MAAKFGQAPLPSPPAPDLENGAALTRPLLQAPHTLRLDGRLSRSSSNAQVPSSSSVERQPPLMMAEGVTSAAFLFAAAWVHLLEILVGENDGPRLVEPSKAPSITVAPETVGVTV